MIYDSFTNIELYKGISEDIYDGLSYLKELNPNIANGVYQITARVKAIVSEYETKKVNENGFEAHKKIIDIQYILKGQERVACLPIETMKETKPYSEEIDAAFYETNSQAQEMLIGNNYFAIFFPQDGHMPCLLVDKAEKVKKIVIKVETN